MFVVLRTPTVCRCMCQNARAKATLAPLLLDMDGGASDAGQAEIAPRCPFRTTIAESTGTIDTPTLPTLTDTGVARRFKEIPGPRGLPVVGNALKYTKLGPYSFEQILDQRLQYQKYYGNIYKEKLGPMWIVHLLDPADIATMFRQEGRYPSRGTIANLEVTYLRRNNKLVGFAFQDGPEWGRQRGYIQKLLMHPSSATRYLHWQVPVARDFAEYLGTRVDETGIVPNLYEDLFKYTMESVGAVAFGERLGAFGDHVDPSCDSGLLSSAIAETFYCFRNVMFSFPWYSYFRTPMYRRFERAANTMREIMAKHVEKVQGRMKDTPVFDPEVETDPFSHGVTEENRSVFEMMAADPRISRDLAENLIMALFRTGIDSTGNALAFLLYNLARNPDKQALLVAELQAVAPGDAPLTPALLARLPYLRAALRESFRLHFPVFGGSGRVLPQDTTFSGYNVPKGTFIFANMAAMSRMDQYFERPLEYHPERWLRDERARMRTEWQDEAGFLSLGFGHGMRSCPGRRFAEQGLYLAVTSILRRFHLDHEGDEMGMINMPFTTPDRPLHIKFTPRDKL